MGMGAGALAPSATQQCGGADRPERRAWERALWGLVLCGWCPLTGGGLKLMCHFRLMLYVQCLVEPFDRRCQGGLERVR